MIEELQVTGLRTQLVLKLMERVQVSEKLVGTGMVASDGIVNECRLNEWQERASYSLYSLISTVYS